MSQLALSGGNAIRPQGLPKYQTLGAEERRAVNEVLDSGVLSQFLGTWSPDFFGGERVQKLERAWERHFDVAHAVSVNSATSGLYAAIGAAGVGPGDEVIVSPYTMSASAVAAVVYGAIPVFADIDPETFCISARTIAEKITPRTRAIIVVDIFGQPSDWDEIMALAAKHQLLVIEDAAQAPGAQYKGRWAGTLGHIGVFSLNYHKTIHSGEGGVCVTNDPKLAERMQLIRNHAEVVITKMPCDDLNNMIGFNYRMTEIEAAIAYEQLLKLDGLVAARQANAAFLTAKLSGLPGLTTPYVAPDVKHGYYVYSMKYDAAATGVPRSKLVQALQAEGLPLGEGYVLPIYLQPMYQQQIAFGRDGFPFTYPGYQGTLDYSQGICPVTEQMHYQQVFYGDLIHAGLGAAEMDDIVAIFHKVWKHLDELR